MFGLIINEVDKLKQTDNNNQVIGPGTVVARNADYYDINKYNQVSSFDSRYYSGADVRLYFENIYFNDAVNIQYQVLEQVMPVYGYASYTADRMLRGSRIIQGAFTINFKRGFYLYSLLENLNKPTNPLTRKGIANKNADDTLINTPSDYEGVLTAINTKNRVEVVNSFKEKFWNNLNNTTPEKEGDTNKPLLDTGSVGFDIYIKYGNPDLNNKEDEIDPETGYTIKDIGTMEVLKGVQLTGVNKIIDDSGRPILESYNFMCKDLTSY